MDLSTIATDGSAVLEIRHPVTDEILTDDAGNPVTVTLVGQDSEQFRKVTRANLNRRIARRKSKLTAEDLEAEGLEALAACTIDWSGIEFEGEVLDCTKTNAMKLFRNVTWLKDQVDAFVGDRAHFLKS